MLKWLDFELPQFKTCYLNKLLAILSELIMLLQRFHPASKNLFDFGGSFFITIIKRKTFMPGTPFMKNVSLVRKKNSKKNKETRLTRSMTVLTNSSASLGTQVCLLLVLPIHSLMASKTFFFQMAGSQYHPLYPALLSDRLTSKLGWLCSRINLRQQTVQCAITGRTHMYYHILGLS